MLAERGGRIGDLAVDGQVDEILELDVAFDESTNSFGYIQPERDDEPIELSPEPNWGRVAYTPR